MAAGAEALYLFQGTLGPGKPAQRPDEAEPKLRHKLDEAWRAVGLIERHAADLEACLQVSPCPVIHWRTGLKLQDKPNKAEPKLRHKLDEAWRAVGLIERLPADLKACL